MQILPTHLLPLFALFVCATTGCTHTATAPHTHSHANLSLSAAPTPNQEMAAAAAAFLDTISPEFKSKAAFSFDGPQRKDWHFVPRTRPGLALRDMTEAQQLAAHNLLRSALSEQGVKKTESLMALESVLLDMERAAGSVSGVRVPLNYAISIFGSPTDSKPWGWRIEGHHLCLNFTSVSNELTAVTPSFMGSNPAEVKSGPKAGMRVLAVEEDLGRQLVTSLNDEQQKLAIIAKVAPADIYTIPGRELDAAIPEPHSGLLYSAMSTAQREVVEKLIGEFAHNLRHEFADHELDRIRKADLNLIRFAWAGSTKPGQGHYYRLIGPTFIIEYDNTQNDANHVHTIWHDRQHDFGHDLLKEHYEHDHKDGHDQPHK